MPQKSTSVSSAMALKVIEAWLKRWWWTIAIPLIIVIITGLVIDLRILMAAAMILMVAYPAALLFAFSFILSRKSRARRDTTGIRTVDKTKNIP